MFMNMLKLLTRWKPVSLYETMPYICSVAAVLAIFHFDSRAGYGAGVLLLIAVICIWKMRKENMSLMATVE